MGLRPLAEAGEPLGLLEALGVGEDLRQELHRHVLGVELATRPAAVLSVPDHAAAEMDQDLRDVDLDGAHLVARPAERGSVGQGGRTRLAYPGELWREDGSYRAGVDRVVGVASGALVDWADVQARRAADAVQSLAPYLVVEHVRAAVIEEDEVELFGAVSLGCPCPERGVRVHPLCGRGAGEELHKDLEVSPGRYHFLYP